MKVFWLLLFLVFDNIYLNVSFPRGGRISGHSSSSHGSHSSHSSTHSQQHTYPHSGGLSGHNSGSVSGHSYPHSNGLSGHSSGSVSGHSYPHSNGLSGHNSGSTSSHTYPHSPGLSGTGSSGYYGRANRYGIPNHPVSQFGNGNNGNNGNDGNAGIGTGQAFEQNEMYRPGYLPQNKKTITHEPFHYILPFSDIALPTFPPETHKSRIGYIPVYGIQRLSTPDNLIKGLMLWNLARSGHSSDHEGFKSKQNDPAMNDCSLTINMDTNPERVPIDCSIASSFSPDLISKSDSKLFRISDVHNNMCRLNFFHKRTMHRKYFSCDNLVERSMDVVGKLDCSQDPAKYNHQLDLSPCSLITNDPLPDDFGVIPKEKAGYLTFDVERTSTTSTTVAPIAQKPQRQEHIDLEYDRSDVRQRTEFDLGIFLAKIHHRRPSIPSEHAFERNPPLDSFLLEHKYFDHLNSSGDKLDTKRVETAIRNNPELAERDPTLMLKYLLKNQDPPDLSSKYNKDEESSGARSERTTARNLQNGEGKVVLVEEKEAK